MEFPIVQSEITDSARMADTVETARGPLNWRAWAMLALLLLPVFMLAMDMSVMFLAIPSIVADLDPSATQQLWTLHVSDLMSAALVLTAGTLADRLGPRRLLAVGLLAYAGFSLLAALSPNAGTLIAARGLLGAAAVAVSPTIMVILRHIFSTDRQFATAVAAFMAAFSGGAAFGPPFGGFLLEHFSWGAIFVANIPVALVVFCAIPLMPAIEGRPAGRIDLTSIGLSLLAVGLFVYGVQEMAAYGISALYILAIVLAIGLGTLFIRRQLRIAAPLFDMRLFANPNFTVALVVLLLFLMAIGASYMQFAQYLQLVLGHSALNAGLLLIVPACLQIVSTALAPRLLEWMHPSTAIACGAALTMAGMGIALFGTTLPPELATLVMVAGDSVGAIGAGPVFAITAGLIISSAPMERTGAASGAQEVAGSLGNLLGLALGGSLAVFIYQAAMAGVGAGGEGISHAIEHAASLPQADGLALMRDAQAAFTHATRAVYGYAIVLLVAFITLTLTGLRRARLDE